MARSSRIILYGWLGLLLWGGGLLQSKVVWAQAGHCERPNLLIVLDRSGSMGSNNKWTNAKNAINSIATQYNSKVRFGLELFSSSALIPTVRGNCQIETTPTIIRNTLNYYSASGGTYMVTAMNVARTEIIRAIRADHNSSPAIYGRRNAIMFITDGSPSDRCPTSEVSAMRNLSVDGRTYDVKTYVIGFGSGVNTTCLNNMANAGGTNRCSISGCTRYYVASNQSDMTTAMDTIIKITTQEQCDGKDNDCDGQTDEGNPGGGGSCNTGEQGVCTTGTWTCVSPNLQCVRNVAPSPESCDGKDNDCDGQIDEGNPGGGGTCNTGQPGVCASGTLQCQSGVLRCVRTTSPSTEVCDGRDNDCDGRTDESFPQSGQSCNTGRPGRCAAGTYQCRSGSLRCESNQNPIAERCNGVDDDCDGQTDEGNPGGGAACNTGRPGRCAAGTMRCTNGSLSCVSNLNPIAERCNGIDDDCDGRVDEGNPQGGSSCVTGLRGICSDGTLRCTNGSLRCIQNQQATAEKCDGLDNDCDGQTDEGNPGGGAACNTGQSGICADGIMRCTGGVLDCVATKRPTAERCDNLDNDCDGSVDENFIGGPQGLGQSCQGGVGACAKTGKYVCRSDGSGTVCNVSAGNPTAEICDGIDNDCDGSIDENDPGGGAACNTGKIGPCAAGVRHCRNGRLQCIQSVQPTAEKCDGKDNDCDGTVDEDFQSGAQALGQSCTSGTGECERTGKYICKSDGSGVTCSAQAGNPTAEKCDGKDNDCDGQTDEDWSNLGQRCTSGTGACQQTGKYVCKADGSGVKCSAQGSNPTAEKCDGKDNDCDGKIDEDFKTGAQALGAKCTAGQGACERSGVYVCKSDGSGVTCDAKAGQPSAEKCDGKDNDCDGKVDEDFAGVGDPCDEGVGACKRSGKKVCKSDGSGLTCSATPAQPSAEKCDGKDNDCDGSTDEDFTDLGTSCEVGKGECKRLGKKVCKSDGSGVTCGAKPGKPSAEKCDGKDNDCDGSTDEDFKQLGRACQVGVGECGQISKYTCKPDGSGVHCDVAPLKPSPEKCDNKDNDCDGKIDENLSQPCKNDCETGLEFCKAGKWEGCTARKPEAEKCDGKDNDCDGDVDEGLTRKCSTPCGDGQEKCVNGKWAFCTAQKPEAEKCDGKDNDCDGKTDEDIPPKKCQGTCGQGTAVCQGGKWTGCSGPQPEPEKCDGIDNDCNGKVDDGLTRSCQTACGEGKEKCVSGQWQDCDAPKPSKEVCDGKDNDCDGKMDNQAVCPSGQVCVEGQCRLPCQGGECPKGQQCRNGYCYATSCKGVTCPKGQVCRNGTCIDPCASVTCPDDKICKEGKCVENNCYGLGCPSGKICQEGKCIDDPCAAVNCSDGSYCKEGRCVGVCKKAQCPSGDKCVEGQCEKDPCAEVKCPKGQICKEGRCEGDPCSGVSCPDGRVCREGDCVDDPCLAIHCPQGTVCREGQCFEEDLRPEPGEEQTIDPTENPNNTEYIPTIDSGPHGAEYTGGEHIGPTPDKSDPAGRGGCLCQASNGAGFPLFSLFLLLLALPLLRQRRRR